MSESEPVEGRGGEPRHIDEAVSTRADDRPPRLIAGAMSGTSGDGVDVAITSITGRGLGMNMKLVRHHHVPYDPDLKRRLFLIRESGSTSLAALAQLGREISLTYARAVNEALNAANLRGDDLAAVAAHGQTLYHAPPNTIQWLDPSLLAAEVGCAVVCDFRRGDLAVGGQGAPLVPYADYLLFRHPTKNRVLLNIGGIANITYLKAGGSIDDVIAFDTGPGNCISDYLCRTMDPQGPGFDVDGNRAGRGREIGIVDARMLKDAYFDAPPPKSTDAPTMIALFDQLHRQLKPTYSLDDLLREACLITANTITIGIVRLRQPVHEVLVSGGGSKNRTIMRLLTDTVGGTTRVAALHESGVLPEAKEALAFALLAAATLDGEPSNVPSVTGARRRVVLGSVTPRP